MAESIGLPDEMADMTISDQPFRFLDLPLELQRKVLEQYFGTPWTVVSIKRCKYRQEDKYRFSLNLNVMLVSRHFHQEAISAMIRAQAGIYDCPMPHSLVQFTTAGPAYFDAAIHTFRAGDSVNFTSDKVLDCVHEKFPNLKIICWSEWEYDIYLLDTLYASGERSFINMLKRQHDQDICDYAVSKAKSSSWYRALEHLTVRWTLRDLVPHSLFDRICYTFELSRASCVLTHITCWKVEDNDRGLVEKSLELLDVIAELQGNESAANT